MSQIWYVDASSLPFDERCKLHDKLMPVAWEVFDEDPTYKTIKLMVDTYSQANAVKALLPAECPYNWVGDDLRQ